MEQSMKKQDFLFRVQDYFGGEYSRTQLEEVSRWCDKQSEYGLFLVYRYIVHIGDTRYKTPPTVARLREIMEELYETYPQLRPESYNQIPADTKQITEGEMKAGKELLKQVIGSLQSNQDPRQNPEVVRIMKENGYEDFGD